MLSAKLLNESATINSYETFANIDFVPGESITLIMQIIQKDREDQLRYMVVNPAAIVTIHLPLTDGTTLDIEMDDHFSGNDRSIWSTELTPEQTENLLGGNFTFDIDELGDGTVIKKGFVQNALSLIVTGDCC